MVHNILQPSVNKHPQDERYTNMQKKYLNKKYTYPFITKPKKEKFVAKKEIYTLKMRAFVLALTVLLMCARCSDACNADAGDVMSCKLLAVMEDDELELKCEVDGTHVFSIDSDSNPEFQLLRNSPDKNLHGLHFMFRGAYISDDQHYLVLPPTAEFSITTTTHRDNGSGRRLDRDPVGDQKVMVVYFRDSTGKTPTRVATGVANSIEDDIFGSYGDQYNLATVVSSCPISNWLQKVSILLC